MRMARLNFHYVSEAYATPTRMSHIMKFFARSFYYRKLGQVTADPEIAVRLEKADREAHNAALISPCKPGHAFRRFLNAHENMPHLDQRIRLLKEVVLQLRTQFKHLPRPSTHVSLDRELDGISAEISRTPLSRISALHAHVLVLSDSTGNSGWPGWLSGSRDPAIIRISLSENPPHVEPATWESFAREGRELPCLT